MAMDNLALRIITQALSSKMEGAFLDKPFALGENQFAFPFHGSKDPSNGGRGTFIVSLGSQSPFICCSYDKFAKVAVNTPFFNALKKMAGCQIKAVSKYPGERIISLETEVHSTLIDTMNTGYDLIIELFPNSSNCYLVPQPYNNITALYKQSNDVFKDRYMSRGLPYIPPQNRTPLSEKDNTLELVEAKLSHSTFRLFKAYAETCGCDKALKDLLSSSALYVIDKNIEPFSFNNKDAKPISQEDIFSFFVKNQAAQAHRMSISSFHDEIKKARDIAFRKEKHLKEDLKAANKRLVYKDYGQELFLHQTEIAAGQESADLDGIHILLNPDLTPVENANSYFKRYHKAKVACSVLEPLIKQTEDEVTYLSNKLLQADKGCSEDLVQLKAELADEGYLKVKKNQRLPSIKKMEESAPHYLKSPDYKIGFGMNAFQNEKLTFSLAQPSDIFLHVKDYPGSHVVILSGDSEATRLLAAELALFLSDLDSGDVMAAPIRKVKKNKAKRGLVNVLEYKLITIHKIRAESIALFKESLRLY